MDKFGISFVTLLLCIAINDVHSNGGLISALRNKAERAFCPESYSPCLCDSTENGLEIICKDVAIQEITDVFYRTKARDLYSIVLTSSLEAAQEIVELPEDLLSEKRSQRIYFACPEGAENKTKLVLNHETFRLSRDYTTHFEIDNCDLSEQTDVGYIEGFLLLHEFIVRRSLNVNISSLTPLPSLLGLTISESTGLVETAQEFPNPTPARITDLVLDQCELGDKEANDILSVIAASTAASSLKLLNMSNNLLTMVPKLIPSLGKLENLDLSFNNISQVPTGSLTFSAPTTSVDLRDNQISVLQSYAFIVEDFKNARVQLGNNQLSELRKDVFLEMLTQMSQGGSGFIDVANNPLSCGCTLSWLIRDNQNLLKHVKNGVCDGFFLLEDLNPESYKDCPP